MGNLYPEELTHSDAGSIVTEIAVDSMSWNDSPVALFSIESANDYKTMFKQSHAVWTKLQPGSVVVFMDFMYPIHCSAGKSRPSVPGFVFVENGLFKLLAISPSSSEASFEVTHKYDSRRGLEYAELQIER